MKALICTSCGASRWQENGNYRICLHCGTKYLITKDEQSPVPTSFSHQHMGRQAESVIALNDDVERLLQKCRTDRKNAKKYANLILDIDPTNEEASKYLY